MFKEEKKEQAKESKLRIGVKNFTSFTEFLTDHLTQASGHILIKASPLLSPSPNAIFILIAFIGYAAGNPWMIAAGILLTFVIEGLGYSAVHARNTIQDHNRRNPHERIDERNAVMVVRIYFAVTLLVIAGFETVPAWIDYFWAKGTLNHLIVSTVILIFPVFSYVGGNIYSLMGILEQIKTKAEAKTEDTLYALRGEIAKLRQDLLDAESRHKAELAKMARGGEIATHQAVEIATRQMADRHRADTAEMATELRILRQQLVQYQSNGHYSPASPVAKPSRVATSASLTPGERQRCEEVAKIVGETGEIRTWKDLETAAGWTQKTAERYGKLAKEHGYIVKGADGIYRPTGIATVAHRPAVTTNGHH